jgi:Methyltransferase domain
MELQRQASFLQHPRRDACQVSQKIGGHRKSGSFIDGQYAVCLDSLRIATKTKNCLVYSFGVGNDWTFDESMHEAGCEVHSFDPSLGIPSHKRNFQHWFHNWGLTGNIGTVDPSWDLVSYSETRRQLNHQTRKVNVLKMDIEGAEWNFLRDAMHDSSLDFIDQLILEVHTIIGPGNWGDLVRQRSMFFHYLEKRGFLLFNSRQNVLGLDLRSLDYTTKQGRKRQSLLYELSFIKLTK